MYSSLVVVFKTTQVLILALITLSEAAGPCNFPSAFTSRPYWVLGRESSSSSTLKLYKYSQTEIVLSLNTNSTTATGRYECDEFGVTGSSYQYVRRDTFNNARVCVEDRIHAGYIVHKEVTAPASPTLSNCDSLLSAVDLYTGYMPVDNPSPNTAFKWSFQNNFPITYGRYYVTYSTDTTQDRCDGDKNSNMQLRATESSFFACDNIQFPNYPLSGSLMSIASMSPTVLGEAAPSSPIAGILFLMLYRSSSNLRQIYCVRYIQELNFVYLSFDVTAIDATCKKGAQPKWFGQNGGRNYMLLKLKLYDVFSTTPSPPSVSSSPSSTVATAPPPTSTPTPAPTTAPTPAPTTPAPTTPAPVNTPAPDFHHVQFAFQTVKYSEVTDQQAAVAGFVYEIAIACGVNRSSLDYFIIQRGPMNNTVVTFDLPIQVANTSVDRFRSNIKTGFYLITLNGQLRPVNYASVYDWHDYDRCPQDVCPNGMVCWILQGNYSCLMEVPTTVVSPPEENSQRDIVISASVVGSAVAVAIGAVAAVFGVRAMKAKDAATSVVDKAKSLFTNDDNPNPTTSLRNNIKPQKPKSTNIQSSNQNNQPSVSTNNPSNNNQPANPANNRNMPTNNNFNTPNQLNNNRSPYTSTVTMGPAY